MLSVKLQATQAPLFQTRLEKEGSQLMHFEQFASSAILERNKILMKPLLRSHLLFLQLLGVKFQMVLLVLRLFEECKVVVERDEALGVELR